MKKVFLGAIFILLSTQLSQSQTILKGIVKEKTNDATVPLPFANVFLEGTTIGTTSDFDGNFTLPVEAGSYKLVFSFIGYQKVTKDLVASGDGEILYDVTLSGGGEKLQELKVEAKINRESETMLMMEQKKAVVAVEAIGARQLAIQGVSDAAAATTKITGITKQEGGRTLNIRGLGDRYNSTSLNGLPLPSNNAETKNIDLELFSSDVIAFVGVEKIPTANLYGDFAGANINIGSKKFMGDPYVSLGLSSGAYTSVLGLEEMKFQDGYSMLGFDNPSVPSSLKEYNFTGTWNPLSRGVTPNMEFSLAAGKSFQLGKGELNSFFTASYDNEYSYSDYVERRVNGSGIIRKELAGDKYNYETQSTAMLNLNYSRDKAQYYVNSMLLNTSDQMYRSVGGFIFDLAEDGAYISRGEYERTMLIVNQILGENQINENNSFNWGVSYNRVLNLIPDRRHITLNGYDPETSQAFFTNNNESDHFRYYHQFIENEGAANITWDHTFGEETGDAKYKGKLRLGYAGKAKVRAFESTQFNHDIYHQGRDPRDPDYYVWVDVNNVDAFLNNDNIAYQNNGGQLEKDGEFFLKTFFGKAVRASTYDGTLITNAGFASLEYNLSDRLLALAGLRGESVYQGVEFETVLKTNGGSNDFFQFKVLPSLSLRYKLNDKNNLRFASSKTYVLPMFTEMALFAFEGITEATVGNPYIYPSDVYNADLKWEFFPKPGESFTIAGFGKYILNPMSRFVMTSASNDFTYANTGDWAYLYGLEIEGKKNLVNIRTAHGARKLFVAANVSLMATEQELNSAKIAQETKDENGNSQVNANFNTETDQLQGAAPLIANASVGYKLDWAEGKKSFTGSMVYNYVSDRIYLIGTNTFGNQVDKAVQTLDFVLKSRLHRWGFSFSAKNLLNPSIDRVQYNTMESSYSDTGEKSTVSNDYIVKSYKKGIKLSLGISYKLN